MSEEVRFSVDTMLGKLARYLRILGYDTVYSRERTDEEFVDDCLDNRIVLTRDRGLYSKLASLGCRSLLLEKTFKTSEILAKLAQNGLIKLEIDLERSRCPLCNGQLRRTVSLTASGEYRETYICVLCGNTYWKGRHWTTIQRTLNEAREWQKRL